jgi:transcriptional regulator with XRE-family HTH domain
LIDKKTQAALIESYRHARGLTQAELANLVGVAESSVRRWEDERDTSRPRAKQIPKLADALGIKATTLTLGPGEGEQGKESN